MEERSVHHLPAEPPSWCLKKKKWPYEARDIKRQIEQFVRERKFESALTLIAAAQKSRIEDAQMKALSAIVHNSLAWEQLLSGNYIQAIDNVEQAIRFDSLNPNFLDTRGQIQASLGKAQEAAKDLELAVKLGAKGPGNFFHGKLYELHGDIESAKRMYQRASESDNRFDDYDYHASHSASARLEVLAAGGLKDK